MSIVLDQVTHTFGKLTVLENFFGVFPSQKVTVLLGPSGCGKTTILNILAGLIVPSRGSVQIEGKHPSTVKVGYMFQDVRLVPWLTIKKNLELVLPSGMPVEEKRDQIQNVLSIVELPHTQSRHPDELSGGMYRRIGMARAYLINPDLYLMDESFQGLDPPLKFQLLTTFLNLRSSSPKTTIFVTHDIEEALLVGDEIHLLSPVPARIVHSIQNPVPLHERRPGNPRIALLEGELFSLFKSDPTS